MAMHSFSHLSREEKKKKSLLSRSLIFVMVEPWTPVEEFSAGGSILGHGEHSGLPAVQ